MHRLLPAVLLLLAPSAHAGFITGNVVGGAQTSGLLVVALDGKNLRTARAQGITVVDTQSGAFKLSVPEERDLFLMVVHGCDAETLSFGRFEGCRRFFPRQEPVAAGDPAVLLQIPSLQDMDAIWSGDRPAKSTPLTWIGLALIACLLVAFAYFRRRPPDVPREMYPTPFVHAWVQWAAAAGCAVLLFIGLGSEPLDLLEYSYFHEGVRPESATLLLTDIISAELAHGPAMPLILRGISGLGASPWLLRLPSLIFGALWVVLVIQICRRVLPRAGVFGAAALAILSPVAVYYARDATPYALAALCGALQIWCAQRAADKKHPALFWTLFGVATVVGFFSHYGHAFVSASIGLALLFAWARRRPRALAWAMFTFAISAIIPVFLAPHLANMFESSGIRFALMSPVYPLSPGAPAFITQFLTVLTGLPANAAPGLLLTVPLWGFGLFCIWKRSPFLMWTCLFQASFVLLFLLFSHTMSTATGGDRVFYAYRWTRPLLFGLIVPLGAAAIDPRARWATAAIAVVCALQSGAILFQPVRPAQNDAVAYVNQSAQAGDAFAVLPAAFYGDPLTYHLAGGKPESLITMMRTWDVPLGGPRAAGPLIRGPLVETDVPFETAVDRLMYRRIWVFAFNEAMFGTPKFDPAANARAIGWLDDHMTRAAHFALPYLDLYRFECNAECAWQGKQRIEFTLADTFQAERYLISGPGFGRPRLTDRAVLALPPNAQVEVFHSGVLAPERLSGNVINLEGLSPAEITVVLRR